MSTNSQPPTAKIYQFPRKGSTSPSGVGREIRSGADHRLRTVPTVEFGSGWYHDAAIQTEPFRKN